MLRQLIQEWRDQASFSKGTRGYVFALCADQLEEALNIQQQEESEDEARVIVKHLFSERSRSERIQSEQLMRIDAVGREKDF
jgi:hypothetical protein